MHICYGVVANLTEVPVFAQFGHDATQESQSAYLFVCENPRELPVKLKMTGDHKICMSGSEIDQVWSVGYVWYVVNNIPTSTTTTRNSALQTSSNQACIELPNKHYPLLHDRSATCECSRADRPSHSANQGFNKVKCRRIIHETIRTKTTCSNRPVTGDVMTASFYSWPRQHNSAVSSSVDHAPWLPVLGNQRPWSCTIYINQ